MATAYYVLRTTVMRNGTIVVVHHICHERYSVRYVYLCDSVLIHNVYEFIVYLSLESGKRRRMHSKTHNLLYS